MQRQERVLALAGFLLIIAALSYVAVLHNRRIGNESGGVVPDQQYVNTIYGFSFSYSPAYRLNELTSRDVELQDNVSGEAIAEVSVEISESNSFKSFNEFAHARAELSCAAGDAQGSVSCPSISRSESFTGKNGASGEVFYLEYQLVFDGATSTREAGPYYAFNISGKPPGNTYTALLVRPSSAAEESDRYDAGAAAARRIVDSLQLTKKSD